MPTVKSKAKCGGIFDNAHKNQTQNKERSDVLEEKAVRFGSEGGPDTKRAGMGDRYTGTVRESITGKEARQTKNNAQPTVNRTRVVPSNPLKADPTRSATLRRIFTTDISVRFTRLKRKVWRLIVDQDAFGLTGTQNKERDDERLQADSGKVVITFEQVSGRRGEIGQSVGVAGTIGNSVENTQEGLSISPTTNAGRWAFQTDKRKVRLFEKWLKTQVQVDILTVTEAKASEAYWKKYVQEGYEKGAGRAFDDVRKPALASGQEQLAFFEGTREEFLRQSFGRPVAIKKVKRLAERVFTGLKDVTDDMDNIIRRQLTEGLAQGMNPKDIARKMIKEGIGDKTRGVQSRAERIARTEIIRAHAEGQLDALEDLGVTEVGVMVEWSSAGDDRVCPMCSALDGVVLTIKEARGILPRHPNCRCAHIPANVGESKKGQQRSKTEVKDAFDDSIRAERKKGSLAEKKDKSKWLGADKTIVKKRPRSVLGEPRFEPTRPTIPKATIKKAPTLKLVTKVTPKPTTKVTPKPKPKLAKPKLAKPKPAKKPLIPKSDVEAKQAAQDYTTDAFQKVNKGLREGKIVNKRIVEGTDKYLKTAPKFEGSTVRSFNVTKKEKAELLKALNKGEVVDKAFVSTRKVPTPIDKIALEQGATSSNRVTFRIKGKSGADISDISLNPGEGEVLYARNTRFKVTGFTETKSGGLIADLEEIAK